MPRPWPIVACIPLSILFGAAVYRAATLSITVDEAYTYTQFVSRPIPAVLAEYDANNHILYTLLAKLTTSVFGAGDLALRLPALSGAALFLAALYRLLRQLAGATLWLPLGVVLIGANTYVADLLPLARGYGLALGLFTLGLSLLLDGEAEDASPRMAGLALGLAVTANLTFLFPVAGLVAGMIWLDRRAGLGAGAAALGIAALLLAAPLWNAGREHFYFGADTWVDSAGSLMGGSLTHDWSERGGPVPAGSVILAAVLATTVAAGWMLRVQSRPLWLLGCSIAMSSLLLAAGHAAAGLPYPYGRTGIYWLLLCGAGLVALAARFRSAALACLAITLAASYFYARAWSTGATIEWVWDSGTRAIAEMVAAQPRSPDGRRVRIGVSGPVSHTLNYYRRTRGWTWLEDVKQDDFRQGEYDFYVLFEGDREWAAAQHLTVLYEHPIAHSFLAARR